MVLVDPGTPLLYEERQMALAFPDYDLLSKLHVFHLSPGVMVPGVMVRVMVPAASVIPPPRLGEPVRLTSRHRYVLA